MFDPSEDFKVPSVAGYICYGSKNYGKLVHGTTSLNRLVNFHLLSGGFGTLGGGLKIPAVQRFKWDAVGRSSCVRMFSGEGCLMDYGVAAGFTGRKMVFEARALKR